MRLAADGHRLVINARSADDVAAFASHLATSGAQVSAVPGDASEADTLARLVDTCRRELDGPPSIGIVNAGGGLPGTVLTSDASRWESLFRVNVVGALRQMRVFAEAMLPAARADPLGQPLDIVVTGSTVGTNVSPFNSVYGASKFAVHGAAEGLRREVGPLGIRVSLVEPGIVGTNFQAAAGYDPAWFDTYALEIGPVLSADDVARAIAFITSQPPHVHLNAAVLRPTRQAYP